MMLTRAATGVTRLTKANEYRRAYKWGKRLKGNFLWVYLFPTSSGKIRAGISISARVAKKATLRNRAKRIIREWLRENTPNIIKCNCDIVVVVKKITSSGKEAAMSIRQELSNTLEKFNV